MHFVLLHSITTSYERLLMNSIVHLFQILHPLLRDIILQIVKLLL